MRKASTLLFVFLFIFAGGIRAAHLVYYDGGLFTQSDYDYYYGANDHLTDTDSDSGPISAYSEVWDDMLYADGGLDVGASGVFEDGIQVALYSETRVSTSAPQLKDYELYSTSQTMEPNVTGGIFFRIETTDPNEHIGDPVRIDYQWTYQSWVDSGIAYFSPLNGFSDMIVAVNTAIPINEDPALSTVVWSHGQMLVDYDDSGIETGSFEATIGDVVGVFMGVSVSLEGYGADDVYSEAYIWMDFGATALPGVYTAADADIDRSGRVDLSDLAILAQFWLESVAGYRSSQ